MAKFYISNSKDLVDFVSKTNESFSIGGNFSRNSIFGIVFNKHIKSLKNAYITKEGGVFIVGTPICEYMKTEEIAKYVYDTFSVENIGFYKKNIMGMWAIFIHKDGKSYCFNDYYALYDVYFAKTESTYAIGNSLADILLGCEQFEFNEYAFIMENFLTGAFPGESQFKDISCLTENQYLIIKDNNLSVKDVAIDRFNYKFNSEQVSIKDIAGEIIKFSSLVNKNFGKVAMFMTGGLDSRLLFAGFLSTGGSMECIHGISNGSCAEDKKIVKKIAEYYQKNLTLLDWEYEKQYSRQNQIDVFNEVGFFNWIDAGNKQYFEELKRIADNFGFLQVGYFCEALRLREWGENKKSDYFSLKEFVEEYCLNDEIRKSYKNHKDFGTYLLTNYRVLLASVGYNGNEEKIPMDFLEPLRWSMARKYDSRFTMMVNMYMPSFLIMSIPSIHERVLCLPANIIKGGAFQIKLIKSLNKELISRFKVFSHRRAFKINNYKKVKVISLRSIADSIIDIAPWTKNFLHKIYALANRTGRSNHYNENEIKDQIQESFPKFFDYDCYSGSLIRLTALSLGLKEIRIKRHIYINGKR